VTITQQDDVQAVVGRGLTAGERVVTTGFARLTEGTAVAVSSAEEAGQLPPDGAPRPDGRRGKGGGSGGGGGKRNPGGPPAKSP
jgi:multidrug efflux system membrane fusion protein